MAITINLNRNYGKVVENTAFLVDEPIVLKFNSDYVLSHCIVHISDGRKAQKFERFNLEEFVLPDEYKKAGELFVAVDLVAKNQIAKHFDVEPIALKETDTELNFIPVLFEQNRKIALLHDAVLAQSELITALSERVALAEEKVNQIWDSQEL